MKFISNSANRGGGFGTEAIPEFINCLVSGNEAEQGGGIFSKSADMNMIHTTIGANTASTGDGLWSEGSSKIYLINSIMANGGIDEIYDSGSGFFNT